MDTELMFSSKTDMWATPQNFFNSLDSEFSFTLDPCACPENAKCKKFFTEKDDGLSQDWGGSAYSVILHTGGASPGNGFKKRTKRAGSPIHWWSVCYPREQIHSGSMIMFCGKQKSGLFAGV